MSVNIKLSPAELIAQATQMQSVQSQMESLFTSITNDLNSINESWSANLAHNFSAKIANSQKCFSNISEMLLQGSNIALESARTFESVDSLLGRVISGAGETVSNIGSAFVDEIEKLPSNYKNLEVTLREIESRYGDFTPEARELFESLWSSEMKAAYGFVSDGIKGELSWKNIEDVATVILGSEKKNIIWDSIKYVYGPAKEQRKVIEADLIAQIKQGDPAGFVVDFAEGFVDIVGGGAINVLGNVAGGVVDDIPGVEYVAKNILGLDQSFGDYVSDGFSYFAEAVDFSTDLVSDSVNMITDPVINGIKSIFWRE